MNVRIPEKDYDRFYCRARQRRVSIQDLIRQALLFTEGDIFEAELQKEVQRQLSICDEWKRYWDKSHELDLRIALLEKTNVKDSLIEQYAINRNLLKEKIRVLEEQLHRHAVLQ